MSDDTAVERRHREVANKLGKELDVFFRDYKTTDGKQLTEGEVMSALGILIGTHCADQGRVTTWMQSITVTAVTANAGKEKT